MKAIIVLFALLSISIYAISDLTYPYNIPNIFQNNGYKVQGIASTCENSNCNNEIIYISIDNTTQDSIILAYQGKDRAAKACYIIDNKTIDFRTSHVGGLAYKNNYLYISAKHTIGKMQLPSTSTLEDTFNNNLHNCTLQKIVQEIPVHVSSFTSFVKLKDNKEYLLVGSFCDDKNIVKSNSRYFCKDQDGYKFPYAYLHAIGSDGNIESTPTAMYKIPYRTQGLDIERRLKSFISDINNIEITYTTSLVASVSDTNNRGYFKWFKLENLKCSSISFSNDCPKYQGDINGASYRSTKKILHDNNFLSYDGIPSHPEDLAITNNKIWSTSEKTDNQKIYYIPAQYRP